MTERNIDPDEARRELYGIMKADLPFEQKAERALELGKRYLGVENGHMTRIDEESNYWKAVASTDPIDGTYPSGLVLDLRTSYCRRTIAQDEPVALHNASNQGWEDDPAFEAHGLECYHGTTITLDDDAYGTVCFVSQGPRADPFDDDETMFAELIARMLEHELERRRTEARIDHLDGFASVVSHDLRSPLTVIRGWIEMAEEAGDVGHLERVYPSIDRMERLLSDVLASARSGRVIGDVEPVSLETVAREVWDRLATGPHELVVEGGTVRADPERLQALLENLFRNAIAHGPATPGPGSGGESDRTPDALTIAVEVVRDANATGTGFAVADDGTGIPDSERDSIFETGFTTSSEGTGFGLAIVRSIADAHGWTIDLAAGEGGARFEITGVDFH